MRPPEPAPRACAICDEEWDWVWDEEDQEWDLDCVQYKDPEGKDRLICSRWCYGDALLQQKEKE